MVGLETSLGLSLRLVKENILSLPDLVGKMSGNPASLLKIPGGTLKIGSVADITIIDPLLEWEVDVKKLRSKSRNTPFEGWKLIGKAVYTIVGGEVKFQNEG